MKGCSRVADRLKATRSSALSSMSTVSFQPVRCAAGDAPSIVKIFYASGMTTLTKQAGQSSIPVERAKQRRDDVTIENVKRLIMRAIEEYRNDRNPPGARITTITRNSACGFPLPNQRVRERSSGLCLICAFLSLPHIGLIDPLHAVLDEPPVPCRFPQSTLLQHPQEPCELRTRWPMSAPSSHRPIQHGGLLRD
jgi:hypothetical protein